MPAEPDAGATPQPPPSPRRAPPPIADLVPHAPPMLAVEELLACTPGREAVARLVVREGSPFARDGQVDAVLALEYMAQTVAACLGYAAYRAGAGIRVGMVIACRSMTLDRAALAVGTALVVRVARVRGADYVSHFDAEVHDAADGAMVGRATLTLVHGEKPPDADAAPAAAPSPTGR